MQPDAQRDRLTEPVALHAADRAPMSEKRKHPEHRYVSDLRRMDAGWSVLSRSWSSILPIGSSFLFLVLVAVFAASRFGLTAEGSILIVSAAIVGGYMALNIGANDVANNMGPAVGGRVLRLADIANVRQLTILSQEELSEVATAMGVSALPASWLGANMVLAGVPDLTQLPPSTRLQFPSGACLVVDMENFPCRQIAEVIAKTHPEAADKFVAAANHKRGVTAWVEREGDIAVGDAVTVWFPPQHDYRHR